MADYSYLGSGKLYLREIGASLGFLEVGNCSALNFAVTEDTKELKDYTQPGGGTYNEVRRISAVEASFSVHDLNGPNLARALYAAVSESAAGAVTNESVTVNPGALSPFANLPNAAVALVVETPGTAAASRANTAAVALGAYLVPAVANGYYYKVTTAGTTAAAPPVFPTTIGGTVTDGTAVLTCAGKVAPGATEYELRAGGVYVLEGGTLAGEVWTIDYTKVKADVVQALVNSGKEYELLFDGLNEARSGKRTRVWAYRVKAGALANLSLIGEEYGVAECTGKLLKDTSKTGVGISQYFKIDIEA